MRKPLVGMLWMYVDQLTALSQWGPALWGAIPRPSAGSSAFFLGGGGPKNDIWVWVKKMKPPGIGPQILALAFSRVSIFVPILTYNLGRRGGEGGWVDLEG